MAKKSKAELVTEGKELKSILLAIRKKPHNFALLIGSDGVHFQADLRKNTEILRKAAKKDGGSNKGAVGVATIDGREINLTCAEGETPPSTLAKLFKKHLMLRGVSSKVILIASDGTILDNGEDDKETATDNSPDTAPPSADSIEAKLRKAHDKMKLALVSALKNGPADHAEGLRKLHKGFEASMAKPDFALALKVLTKLRQEVARTPSAERLIEAVGGKGDPAKLAKMGPLLDACIERAGKEANFDKTAKPQLQEMRTALKEAMKGKPPPDDLSTLTAMKKKLDEVFLADLGKQGHGPARHEGKVTPEQLTKRAVDGKDPMTGTTTDGVHGGTHRYSRHATRFKDPGDYVDADETIRSKPEFTTEKDSAKKVNDTRFSVKLTLKEAMGDDYKKMLEGVSRIGSAKNPTGSQPTDFEGGTLTAVYDILSDGSYALVTMYPNPQ